MQVNQSEALRYMGWHGAPDAEMQALISDAAAQIEAAAVPRWVTREVRLARSPDGIAVEDTILRLPGTAIAELLTGCERAILLCATLGAEVERLLRSAALGPLLQASALDACASSGIEVVCDTLQASLEETCRSEGFQLTQRFSPGYGDFPLSIQKDFCAVLDAARLIGVTVSQSGILIPRKSVTAVIGLSPVCVQAVSSCETCAMAKHCAYRKEGKPCAAPRTLLP